MTPKSVTLDLNNNSLDWLKQWARYSPEAVAIQDGDTGDSYSYKQLFQSAQAGAQVLSVNYGVGAGDRVAVLATNELDYVVLFFSLQRLGATLVPVNYRLTAREVDHIVSDCSPKLVISQIECADRLEKLSYKTNRCLLSQWSAERDETSAAENAFIGNSESIAMIIYTSGTTGAPKGAMISNNMLFWNSINTSLRLDLSERDCAVIFLPFFHTGGWNVLTTPFLHRGAKLVFIKKFDADQILRLSETEKATLLFGVPTTMDLMAKTESFVNVDLSSLRYAIVGGEPMPLPLIEIWHNKGVAIRQGYGLTEFGPNVFSLSETDAIRKMGSIGFPNFYVDAKIIDENFSELSDEQVGELVLRGPMCMSGYWNNPTATSETMVDGWLRTGDLVRRDREGYYYVVGRKKDMYKSGGENVYPVELEQVLRGLPGVSEVAVIGVPDPKWGEVGKAFIVRSHLGLTENEVLAHCQDNLAKFKIPKHIQFVENLPKGDSGKVLKRELFKNSPSIH